RSISAIPVSSSGTQTSNAMMFSRNSRISAEVFMSLPYAALMQIRSIRCGSAEDADPPRIAASLDLGARGLHDLLGLLEVGLEHLVEVGDTHGLGLGALGQNGLAHFGHGQQLV